MSEKTLPFGGSGGVGVESGGVGFDGGEGFEGVEPPEFGVDGLGEIPVAPVQARPAINSNNEPARASARTVRRQPNAKEFMTATCTMSSGWTRREITKARFSLTSEKQVCADGHKKNLERRRAPNVPLEVELCGNRDVAFD